MSALRGADVVGNGDRELEPVHFVRHTEAVTTVLVVYGILLFTSVVFGAISNHGQGLFGSDHHVSPEETWWHTAIFEAIDTVIVLWCWFYVRSLPAMPHRCAASALPPGCWRCPCWHWPWG